MNILLTGASGFVGRHLLPSLAANHRVQCLVRDPTISLPLGVQAVVADLDALDFAAALPDGIDCIVHLAQGSGKFPQEADSLYRVNLASTERLASYARRIGVRRFVFTSTGNVYRKSVMPLVETDPTDASEWYAFTKCATENLLACHRECFEVAVLRLFAPYGPGQTGRLIPGLIERVRQGISVVLNGPGYPLINPIYIADLCKILVQAIEGRGSYTVNVAGPANVSIADVANFAGQVLRRPPVFEAAIDTGTPPFNLIADTQAMTERFGRIALVHPRDGIAATIQRLAR